MLRRLVAFLPRAWHTQRAAPHCATLQITKYSGEKMSFTKVFTTKKHQEAKLGEGCLSSFAQWGSF